MDRLGVSLVIVSLIAVVLMSPRAIGAWARTQGTDGLITISRSERPRNSPLDHRDSLSCRRMLAQLERAADLQPALDVASYLHTAGRRRCGELLGAAESALVMVEQLPATAPLRGLAADLFIDSYLDLEPSRRDDLQASLVGSEELTAILLGVIDEMLARGSLDNGRTLSELGVRVSDTPSSFYLRLGEVEQKQGELDSSLELYQAALQLDSFYHLKDKSRIHVRRGEILLWTERDIAQSIEDFDTAIEIQHDNYFAHVLKGLALFRHTHALTSAQAVLEAAIAINPSRKEAFTILGDLFSETGRTEAARQAYREVLVRDPEDVDARRGLAELR